jgi:hypothetical protein
MTVTITSVLRSAGSEMYRNDVSAPAPSTRHASWTSRGIVRSAARISTKPNGYIFHADTKTSVAIDVTPLPNKSTLDCPVSSPRSSETSPTPGVMSHCHSSAVTTAEVIQGSMNTTVNAVRRCLRLLTISASTVDTTSATTTPATVKISVARNDAPAPAPVSAAR